MGESRALSHLTICDLTGQLAGAGSTRYLAALGARVIRVEDPVRQGRWDILRGATPHVDDRRGIELGGAFNNHNVEKMGVTLNLRLESGRDLLRRLVAVSDVVTENFAAGVMTKLGFSYDELRAIRPDIVYVSNCGFGHVGPYSHFKTFGQVVQAVCGLSFGVGAADPPPAAWGFSYMDHMGANIMAVAIPDGGGPVGGHVLHRCGSGPDRTGPVGLHGELPTAAPRRHARLQSQRPAGDGTARHLPDGGGRPLGRHRLSGRP
jgi:crotonobetainyl-CoA:carnitine CoA-transferase CaiB-like acyl-CoA transferase